MASIRQDKTRHRLARTKLPSRGTAMRLIMLVLLCICVSIGLGFDDKADASRDHAAAYWKTNVRKQQGNLSESHTEHAVVYGSVDMKQLESIGKAAERAIVF